MDIPKQQVQYWDRVASEKNFGHPLDVARLEALVGRDAAIVDVGCGYGRLCAQLRATGFSRVTGVDSSAEMIQRGQQTVPALDLRVAAGNHLPFAEGTFDAALLFTILTSAPSDETQRQIVAEVHRILCPGGLLIVSDLLLQTDERNRERYKAGRVRFGVYGVFELPDGGVCRHHEAAYIRRLLNDFVEMESRELSTATMNGHAIQAFQYYGRKR
jgi:SAM-dependent methyltransferase